MLTIRPDLMKFPAPGLEGGADGLRGNVLLNGVKVERFTPISWKPGDEIVLQVPGGGGFGDPLERERELVWEDLRLGLCHPGKSPRPLWTGDRCHARIPPHRGDPALCWLDTT